MQYADAKNFHDNLAAALSLLVPYRAQMNVTLENLNTQTLAPTKNHDIDRLESSPLQLPTHSLVLLNETALDSGQLNEIGVRNVQTIGTVVQDCKVP